MDCPLTKIIDVISRKWTLLILRELMNGKKRFNELMKAMRISPRTLSKRLDELEKMGIVERKQFNEIPPRVEYSLTESGLELIECFKLLDKWVRKWLS